jgi:DNA polymerase-3 subunit epsilon
LLEKNPVIDTLSLARRKHPGASNSLDALCARYGIDRSRRTKHGALIDSEILAEVYLELKVGRQSSLTFSAQKEIRKIDHSGLLTSRSAALVSTLSTDEIAGHEKLVEKMNGRSLWTKYGPRVPS